MLQVDRPPPLVAAREVAERLSVTEDTVYRLASAGEVPFFRVGKRALRFDLVQVLGVLRGRSMTPASDAEHA